MLKPPKRCPSVAAGAAVVGGEGAGTGVGVDAGGNVVAGDGLGWGAVGVGTATTSRCGAKRGPIARDAASAPDSRRELLAATNATAPATTLMTATTRTSRRLTGS